MKQLGFQRFGSHIGGACAFKWDLGAKVDDSMGMLLPIEGLSLFPKEVGQPKVDFGAREARCGSSFRVPGAPRMHNDTSASIKKNEVSKDLDHKSQVHVHSSGT